MRSPMVFALLAASLVSALGATGGDSRAFVPTVYRSWETFTTADGLPDDHVDAVYASGDELWVGTRKGLARRKDGAWQAWTRREGLSHPAITAIDKDFTTGDLWLGTWGGGLVRFSAGRFDTFDQMNSGLSGNLVFAVKVADGRVWAANNAGLSAYDPLTDAWSLYAERRADGPHRAVTGLWADAGTLMASVWRDGIWRFDRRQDRWAIVTRAREHLPPRTLDPGVAGDGTLGVASVGDALWWATQDHLLRRIDRRPWESRPIPHLATNSFVYCLGASDGSQAWLGTGEGLQVLTDWETDTWVGYRRCGSGSHGVVTLARDGKPIGHRVASRPIPDNQVRSIAFASGDVWVGTANGLARGSDRVPWDRLARGPGGSSADVPDCPATTESDGPQAAVAPSVAIALRAPVTRTVTLPGDRPSQSAKISRLAVRLAVQRANARGGFRGRTPFEVVTHDTRYADYAWGTREDDLAAYASRDDIVGIVGASAADDRIVELSALRSEVPFLAIPSTPAELDGPAGWNPWTFRCRGEEPRQHRLFLDHLIGELGLKRLAAVRTPGSMTQRHMDWWADYARERGQPLEADLKCPQDAHDVDEVLARLRSHEPDAILTWASAQVSAMILRAMRRAKMDQLFVGGSEIVCQEFVHLVGDAPGPVIALYPSPHHADREVDPGFAEEFARYGGIGDVERPLDGNVYLSFDATEHLLEAVSLAGVDRRAVRRTLAAMAGSAHGEAHFERSRPPGKVVYARLHQGRWQLSVLP